MIEESHKILDYRALNSPVGWNVSWMDFWEPKETFGKVVLAQNCTTKKECKDLKIEHPHATVCGKKDPKHFILLKLDSPRDKSKTTDAEKAQYKELSAHYKVRGVPAIYLTDAEGNPFYSTSGYGGQKADEWVEQMVAKTGIPKALAKAAERVPESMFFRRFL